MKSLLKQFVSACLLIVLSGCGNSSYKMAASTMEPTIEEGEVIEIEKTADIARDDIVAFKNTASQEWGKAWYG